MDKRKDPSFEEQFIHQEASQDPIEDSQDEDLEFAKSFSFNLLPLDIEENSAKAVSAVLMKAEKVPFLSQCEPQQVDEGEEKDQNDRRVKTLAPISELPEYYSQERPLSNLQS